MDIAAIEKKMIEYSDGNLHDIAHLIKVHSYARMIGELEGLDRDNQLTLEIAALLHDIACPLCRKKYGNTDGKHQEAEGAILAREFLSDTDIPDAIRERVVYLVSHHHTYTCIDGIDYQILLEADFLVNADESCYTKKSIESALESFFRTKTGISLLRTIYSV